MTFQPVLLARVGKADSQKLATYKADGGFKGLEAALKKSPAERYQSVAELTDGVVVGSRAVQVAEDGPGALGEYVASLRAALDAG